VTASDQIVVLPNEIEVVNVGLALFAESVAEQGRPVVQVDWRIPADGDPATVGSLARLHGVHHAAVSAANTEVFRRLDTGVPMLTSVGTVRDVVPDVDDRTLLHCGPAISWTDVCDPLRRSMRAAVVAEGWADDVDGADRLLADREVTLHPANEHSAVVPMASAVAPSMPVWVVDNEDGGTRAFAPLNQGPGDVAWFGRDPAAALPARGGGAGAAPRHRGQRPDRRDGAGQPGHRDGRRHPHAHAGDDEPVHPKPAAAHHRSRRHQGA
jgi:hypothetical protein